jgi:hypothetical protein
LSEIEATIKKAEEMLETARCGFEDLIANDKSRRIVGLRNLIVFGRTVTFVLQNLRSKMAEGEFDAWYTPKQEEMKKNYVMKHFVTLRCCGQAKPDTLLSTFFKFHRSHIPQRRMQSA